MGTFDMARFVFATFLWLAGAMILATAADAQSAPLRDLNGDGIPDRDDNGNGIADQDEVPSGNISQLEVACVSYGTVNHCLAYHMLFCQSYGMQDACRPAAIGQNCQGGDPGACNFYIALIEANRDCNARFYQPACDWLSQQRF